MTEPIAIASLKRQRAGIAGRIVELRREIDRLQADLFHVDAVLKIYGEEAEFAILELNDERMLLLDADGKTRYDWRRQESASE